MRLQGVMWPVTASVDDAELSEGETLESVVVRAPAVALCAPSDCDWPGGTGASAPGAEHAPRVQLHAPHGILTIRQVLEAVQRVLCGAAEHDISGSESAHRMAGDTPCAARPAAEGVVLDGLRRVSAAGCSPIVYAISVVHAAPCTVAAARSGERQ